jgi:hypothetical protein
MSRIWPIDAPLEPSTNALRPCARYSAVDSSSFQPSRIGLGSIRGAPLPAGRI